MKKASPPQHRLNTRQSERNLAMILRKKQAQRLSIQEITRFYRMRWGIEVEF